MGHPVTPLGDLGRQVAATQDRLLARPTPAAVKQRLLATPRRRGSPPASRWSAAALIGAFAAVIAALLIISTRPPPAMTFAVESAPGRAGEWMASAATELSVRFSDGSVLTLAPESRARVAALDADGAVVVLERGGLDASIIHRPVTRWQIDVGPFSVKVTGTRFVVRWDPDTETLRIELKEGSTRVVGPKLGDGRVVTAGETLSISTKQVEADPAVVPSKGAAPAVLAPASAPPPSAPPPVTAPTATSSAPTSAGAAPSWLELAASGKYKEALQQADAEGFDALLESAGAPDLLTLADAARLAGSLDQASRAYLAVRRRFAASQGASVAAFNLGRIAFDQRGAFASAAQWFRTYLAEQPRGTFARNASGRLVEALDRAGDAAGARGAARAYLEAWPDGPHAEKARSVLANP
jgi:hypothetical protein